MLTAFAVALAAPAFAGDSIHISTAGKTPEQIHLEIRKAAEKLCREEYAGALIDAGGEAACVQATVHAALAQSGDPDLMRLALK
jgi:hypothetical protein